MAFHRCAFECVPEVTMAERMLFHKYHIYMVMYGFECAFLVHLMMYKLYHIFYTRNFSWLDFLPLPDNGIVNALKGPNMLSRILNSLDIGNGHFSMIFLISVELIAVVVVVDADGVVVVASAAMLVNIVGTAAGDGGGAVAAADDADGGDDDCFGVGVFVQQPLAVHYYLN